mmetsp:Transcript_18729/g.24318  ORF Transcript_18729/g.24318 Transcript_18729/m.24318 type:complete len:579 (+) Transcript_18729:66-1802(+)
MWPVYSSLYEVVSGYFWQRPNVIAEEQVSLLSAKEERCSQDDTEDEWLSIEHHEDDQTSITTTRAPLVDVFRTFWEVQTKALDSEYSHRVTNYEDLRRCSLDTDPGRRMTYDTDPMSSPDQQEDAELNDLTFYNKSVLSRSNDAKEEDDEDDSSSIPELKPLYESNDGEVEICINGDHKISQAPKSLDYMVCIGDSQEYLDQLDTNTTVSNNSDEVVEFDIVECSENEPKSIQEDTEDDEIEFDIIDELKISNKFENTQGLDDDDISSTSMDDDASEFDYVTVFPAETVVLQVLSPSNCEGLDDDENSINSYFEGLEDDEESVEEASIFPENYWSESESDAPIFPMLHEDPRTPLTPPRRVSKYKKNAPLSYHKREMYIESPSLDNSKIFASGFDDSFDELGEDIDSHYDDFDDIEANIEAMNVLLGGPDKSSQPTRTLDNDFSSVKNEFCDDAQGEIQIRSPSLLARIAATALEKLRGTPRPKRSSSPIADDLLQDGSTVELEPSPRENESVPSLPPRPPLTKLEKLERLRNRKSDPIIDVKWHGGAGYGGATGQWVNIDKGRYRNRLTMESDKEAS